ncbi:MAG: PASTA domain-containing protein [Coriobacteriia bacterium]|nr:PASTA domain-containing protein [Coriobacteriia bacterium]
MTELGTGTRIAGRYSLESRLDAGGRAQVWAATDDELQRKVAIKILITPAGGDPAFIEAFRAEAQAEAGLKHPGIVEVFDWGHDGDVNFIVMDLLSGHTVRQALDAQGRFAWQVVLGVGRQISSALAYAHHAEIAHGHLSAERIVVSADGNAAAIGFGLHCRGGCEIAASPDADTFALGGVLYEMLTGSSPFGPAPEGHPQNQPWPTPVRHAAPDAPHELDRIVMKAISPDPAQRYRTAAELQADLDALARPKSRAWLWWTLAVLAVLIAAGATWYFSSQQKAVVPDITGKSQSEAESLLSNAGFKLVVSGQAASSAVPTATIISENPASGSAVRKGSQIAVVISTGLPTVAMPSVSGVSLTDASSAIASAGLTVGAITRQNSDTFPADTVISSSQAPGAQVTQGTPVDLVVSAGQKTVTVPDVRGISQSNATSKLTNAGLKTDVGQAYSSQPVGTVVSQGPAAGSTVPAGSTITISVSQGRAPVVVPDLTGATTSAAQNTLTELGLVPLVSKDASGTAAAAGRPKGTVHSQSPESGESVQAGSQVTINIYN